MADKIYIHPKIDEGIPAGPRTLQVGISSASAPKTPCRSQSKPSPRTTRAKKGAFIRIRKSSTSQHSSEVFRRVRKQGYGFSDEEIAKGVRALAAPVRDAECNVIATIGISLPSFELPNSRIERVAKAVKESSQEVSKRLRWE